MSNQNQISLLSDEDLKQKLIDTFEYIGGVMPITTASDLFAGTIEELKNRGLDSAEKIKEIVTLYEARIEQNSKDFMFLEFNPN